MTTIRVEIPDRPYDVVIGPLEAVIGRIRDLARGERPILISEPRLFALHGQAVADALEAEHILVPEGEAAKSWDQLHLLLAAMAERRASRSSLIVALGGGSVGDVAGLAASLFKRGCQIVHVPTTLLSQADSAVGGKTAIDAFGEKNLIGTFHQPALVAVDPSFLDTLDARQMRSGYAEIVKYGLIDDTAFFAWCEANGRGVLAGHPDLRRHAISTAVAAKARIISGDVEDRSGKRALLNLGHSFAHAIEAEAGLGSILHGEAVALGLCLAFRLSVEKAQCPTGDAERVIEHLQGCGLPTRLADVGLSGKGSALAGWMAGDKKNVGSRATMILVRGIGRAYLDRDVDRRRLGEFLERVA